LKSTKYWRREGKGREVEDKRKLGNGTKLGNGVSTTKGKEGGRGGMVWWLFGDVRS
jgi:hypothetical protein